MHTRGRPAASFLACVIQKSLLLHSQCQNGSYQKFTRESKRGTRCLKGLGCHPFCIDSASTITLCVSHWSERQSRVKVLVSTFLCLLILLDSGPCTILLHIVDPCCWSPSQGKMWTIALPLPKVPKRNQVTIALKFTLGNQWVYWTFLQRAGEMFSTGMWVFLFQHTALGKPYPGGIRGPFSPMDGVSLACQIQRKLQFSRPRKAVPISRNEIYS